MKFGSILSYHLKFLCREKVLLTMAVYIVQRVPETVIATQTGIPATKIENNNNDNNENNNNKM